MKVGDLVRDNHPNSFQIVPNKIGVIVGQSTERRQAPLNKSFKVLWRNGTIGNNVWDYDLKVVNESR